MVVDNQFNRASSPKPKSEPPAQSNESTSEAFKTPEEVSARDSQSTASPILGNIESQTDRMPKNTSKKKRKFSWRPTKKQALIGIPILIILLIGGYFGYKHFTQKHIVVRLGNTHVVVTAPTTVPSNLTGLQVNPSVNKLPVTAVMIENSTDARPQSGLGQAGVVFEAVAEGGVTRFMALYQDTSPSSVGPIRSARPYYVQWELGFDAAYAHVGGSPDALADISSWGVRDLNQFSNGGSYTRVTTRAAPHNVYTSIATLNQLEDSKGYTSSQYTSWPRKPAKPTKVPTASTINVNLSGAVYNAVYTYNPKTNSYARDEGGVPQIDAISNTQVSPQVVITIVVPESQGALDASGAYYSDYNVIGSGQADIFQDGEVTVGQWTKTSNTSQIQFTDSNSKPIALIPGQTWITAITSASGVSYTN